MKLEISILICAVALTCTAAPADEQSIKCALCSDFIEMMNLDDIKRADGSIELLDEFNLASCLAVCNSDYANGDSNSIAPNSVALLSMVGCTTCKQMVVGATSNLYSYDYSSIRHAVKHACSTLDGIVKTARCRIFIKARLNEIVDAVFHYHANPQAACIKLGQC